MRLQNLRSLHLILLTLITLALAGCGPQTPEEAADSTVSSLGDPSQWDRLSPEDSRELNAAALLGFSLSLSSPSITLDRGTSAGVTVNVARQAGFTGTVSLSLDRVGGFSAVFFPANVGSTTASSRMTLSVASTVSPGTYNLTIRGVSGTLVRTTVLQVTVRAPVPTFNVTLKNRSGQVLTGPLPAQQNRTTRLLVQVDKLNGFSDPVTLSLLGLPTGVFSREENLGSNTTTVHLIVENFSVPGSSSVTVRAQGGGEVKLTPFTLQVTSNPIELDADSTGLAAQDLAFGESLGGISLAQQGSTRPAMTLQADGSILTGEAFSLSHFNAGGLLDRQFGGNTGEPIRDLAVQEDGRIVTVGTLEVFDPFSEITTFTLIAARFDPSGAKDTTFGVGGHFQLNSSTAVGSTILPLAWGRSLIAGVDGNKLLVLRLTPGGNLDPDFNGDGNIDGQVRVDFGASAGTAASAPDMVLDSNGRILLASAVGGKFALARLGPNGAPDLTFGVGGRVVTNIAAHTLQDAVRIVLDAQGRIVVVGTATAADGFSRDMLVARLLPDGGVDGSFGQGGQVTVDFAGLNDSAASVALQPDGKILVGGRAKNAPGNDVDGSDDFALVRLGDDGSLDTSFGQGGKVVIGLHDFSMAFSGPRAFGESITDLIVLPDGRILAAGHARVVSDLSFNVVMRFNP